MDAAGRSANLLLDRTSSSLLAGSVLRLAYDAGSRAPRGVSSNILAKTVSSDQLLHVLEPPGDDGGESAAQSWRRLSLRHESMGAEALEAMFASAGHGPIVD
jgi:hypothetical protein